MRTNYPTKQELEEVFFIRNNDLWRRVHPKQWTRWGKEKLVENVANTSKGYCMVGLKKDRTVFYHNIIWILSNGDILDGYIIDHEDCNKLNNNIENLRAISQRQNCQNKQSHRNGKLVGCHWCKRDKKWVARIMINCKHIHLGLYSTEQEAHDVYLKACGLKEFFVCQKSYRDLVNTNLEDFTEQIV